LVFSSSRSSINDNTFLPVDFFGLALSAPSDASPDGSAAGLAGFEEEDLPGMREMR
jgi:hypothetical protein